MCTASYDIDNRMVYSFAFSELNRERGAPKSVSISSTTRRISFRHILISDDAAEDIPEQSIRSCTRYCTSISIPKDKLHNRIKNVKLHITVILGRHQLRHRNTVIDKLTAVPRNSRVKPSRN